MKKQKFFAYACAIAMVSSVAFTSCKKDDEPATETQQSEDVVKTEFSIALPKQLSGRRNMPSATVQKNGVAQFQGIADGIVLVPFANTSAITSTDTRLGANVVLSQGVVAADLGTNSNAKTYSDVDIPLSTASFLFYGKSAAAGDKFNIGSLTEENLTEDNPKKFAFNLEPICADANGLTASTRDGGKLLQYLTNVAIADDGQATPKKWYQYTAADDPALKAMFDTYTTIHGLSSFEVARIMTDLYQSLMPISSPIATAIKTAIKDDDYASVSAEGVVTLNADYNNFPQSAKLPDGSIDVKWDGDAHKFVVGAYANMAKPDTYAYPAQLWYYSNSLIKTSNTSKQTAYDNDNNWNAILALHTDAAAVNPATRAVAIVNPVQYAVGRLDVAIKLNSASLADNSETVEGIATDVDCSTGFQVTAILVGGQKNVGFDFSPEAYAGEVDTEYTIYDNVMTSTAEDTPADMIASTTLSSVNSTLVLENSQNVDVMIAVEMLNDKADFYGAGGQLIPKGGKFYVIAKLEATAATETGNKVFKQDFTTTANLNLKSLQAAYNTIPDLRTPKLELGFSVDLTWQNGHAYSIDIN